MIQFFSDCSGLFTHTFNAALALDFFQLLAGFVLFEVCIALFLQLCRGTRRI